MHPHRFKKLQGEGTFPTGPIRGVPRDHYIHYQYQQHLRAQEVHGHTARSPHFSRLV